MLPDALPAHVFIGSNHVGPEWRDYPAGCSIPPSGEGWHYLALLLTILCSAVVLQAGRRAALCFGGCTLWVLAGGRHVLLGW